MKTRYLGLELKSPVVPSASPLMKDIDTVKRLEEAGAGAIVMDSLFEEEILQDQLELHEGTTTGTDAFAEALSFFPEIANYRVHGEDYLDRISNLKKAVSIPVIASLNGHTPGGWTNYAARFEEAGADAVELNIYSIETDPEGSSAEIEDGIVGIVREVKGSVSIPVAVKLSPYYTSLAALAARLDEAGADALVLFNRFYQPDIDISSRVVKPHLNLSGPQAIRLPLRWIALLHGRLRADLAATGGVRTGYDCMKLIMAGATIVQTASALLERGPGRLSGILDELRGLFEKEGESLEAVRGLLSAGKVEDPSAFERALYFRTLKEYV